MSEIRLAKALRLKNKLAGEIGELGRRIQGYNTHREENDPPFKVDEVWQQREKLVQRLVELKSKISAANGPIQAAIFRLAELKAAIAVLKDMDTKEGVIQDPYNESSPYTVKAQWDAMKVAETVDKLAAEIEVTQDLIDAHNAKTTIS